MKHSSTRSIALFLTGFLALCAGLAIGQDHTSMRPLPGGSPMAGASLFNLKMLLTDQSGKRFRLSDEQAAVTIVTMFYGDCQIACPIALENVKRTVMAVPEKQRSEVRALLISLNPGMDTPTSLKKLAQLHELPAATYRFAVADNDADTRQLAAALGIKYRRLPSGEINHSTRFLLFDANGIVVADSEKLGAEPDLRLVSAMAASRHLSTPNGGR